MFDNEKFEESECQYEDKYEREPTGGFRDDYGDTEMASNVQQNYNSTGASNTAFQTLEM